METTRLSNDKSIFMPLLAHRVSRPRYGGYSLFIRLAVQKTVANCRALTLTVLVFVACCVWSGNSNANFFEDLLKAGAQNVFNRGAWLVIENGTGEDLYIDAYKVNCFSGIVGWVRPDYIYIPRHTVYKAYVDTVNSLPWCAFSTSDFFAWVGAKVPGDTRSGLEGRHWLNLRCQVWAYRNGSVCHVQDGQTMPLDIWDVHFSSLNTSSPVLWRYTDQDTLFVSINRNQPSRWMTELGEKLHNLQLSEAMWPGTHDSLAGQDIGLTVCNQPDSREILALVNKLPVSSLVSIPDFMRNMAVAQRLSLRAQLDRGIRYLDARFCLHNGRFLAAHTLVDPNLPLEKFVEDLKQWSEDPLNAKEIVIVNLRLDDGEKKATQGTRAVLEYVHRQLHSRIVTSERITPASTFKDVWQTGRNLLMMTDESTEDNYAKTAPWFYGKKAWMTDGKYDYDVNKIRDEATAEVSKQTRSTAKFSRVHLERSPPPLELKLDLDMISTWGKLLANGDTLEELQLKYGEELLHWLRKYGFRPGIQGVNIYIRDFSGGAIDGLLARDVNDYRAQMKRGQGLDQRLRSLLEQLNLPVNPQPDIDL